MLRVPGTLNYKQGTPRPVEIIGTDDARYDVGDFDGVIGAYMVSHPPAPAPVRKTPPRLGALNTMRALDRCMAYVAKLPRAISGQGGHDATLRVACECFRFGLDMSDAFRVMEWFNATKCDPPWSLREIDHKVEDARKKVSADGEIGIKLQRNIARRNNGPRLSIAPLRAGAFT